MNPNVISQWVGAAVAVAGALGSLWRGTRLAEKLAAIIPRHTQLVSKMDQVVSRVDVITTDISTLRTDMAGTTTALSGVADRLSTVEQHITAAAPPHPDNEET